jgi:hypothetical protein
MRAQVVIDGTIAGLGLPHDDIGKSTASLPSFRLCTMLDDDELHSVAESRREYAVAISILANKTECAVPLDSIEP